jgi:hypothetical protein
MSDVRQPKGQTSGGEYASHDRDEATMTLERTPTASAKDIQAIIDNALFAENDRANQDEVAPATLTWRNGFDSMGELDDEKLSTLVEGTASDVRHAFASRAIDEGLDTEMPAIAVRQSNGWHFSTGEKQHLASESVDERLGEYESLGHYSRADYAEVGEEGIAYGFSVNPQHLAEIVGGEIRPGESDDDYMERVTKACPDYYNQLADFFSEEYGADLVDDGGEMDIAEFYVEYESGGAQKSTIEYMGDRVENETKLLAFQNEWLYGGHMKDAWAKKLGYSFELSSGPDRRFGDGQWTKDA